MLAFQKFQHQLAAHVRDPHHTRRPAGVPARRMAVYNELLFNNVCGFLDNCFPVCRDMLGEVRWRRLCRTFFRDGSSHTPWFREIPREFVRYLSTRHIAQALPHWLADLAYYEWAELAVEVMDVTPPAHDPQGDLMQARVLLNPARLDVVSAWPVHRIGPDWQARKPTPDKPTCLVVFRNLRHEVCFTEINPLTAHVLGLLDRGLTGQEAMAQLASEVAHPDPVGLADFGHQLLIGLREQDVILGTCT